MKRLLAAVCLVLLVIGLLLSMYAFFQGQIAEGLYLLPLLVFIYVLLWISNKKAP